MSIYSTLLFFYCPTLFYEYCISVFPLFYFTLPLREPDYQFLILIIVLLPHTTTTTTTTTTNNLHNNNNSTIILNISSNRKKTLSAVLTAFQQLHNKARRWQHCLQYSFAQFTTQRPSLWLCFCVCIPNALNTLKKWKCVDKVNS